MAHRYRLGPTAAQVEVLAVHCRDARFVWNLARERANCWRPGRPAPPGSGQRFGQLAEARGDGFLGAGSSSVRQQALRDFDRALRNRWAGTHRRPTWRKRGRHEGFCVRDVPVERLNRKWARLQIPKLGWVRFRPVARQATGKAAGVDRGSPPRWSTRTVSTTGHPRHRSSNPCAGRRCWRGPVRAPAGCAPGAWRLASGGPTFGRADRSWRTGGEDLHPAGRGQRRDRARAAADQGPVGPPPGPARSRPAGGLPPQRGGRQDRVEPADRPLRLGLLERRVADKANASGVAVVFVDPHNTSRQCAACGHVAAENRESQAVFCCRACGHQAHADHNPAINILARGLHGLAPAPGPGAHGARVSPPATVATGTTPTGTAA